MTYMKKLVILILFLLVSVLISINASSVYINCCEMSATGGVDIGGNPICQCADDHYYTACGEQPPMLTFLCPPEFLNPQPEQPPQPNVNTVEGCNSAGYYWLNGQCINGNNANSYCQTQYGQAYATRYPDGTMGCACNQGYTTSASGCVPVQTGPDVNTKEGCSEAGHYWRVNQCISLDNANSYCQTQYGPAFATRNPDGTMGCA